MPDTVLMLMIHRLLCTRNLDSGVTYYVIKPNDLKLEKILVNRLLMPLPFL